MKNVFLSFVLVGVSTVTSFGGDCSSGRCVAVRNQRVVTVTKNVVRETVVIPKRILTGCTNGVCRNRTVTIVR